MNNKIYGKKGKPVTTSDSYNTSIRLETRIRSERGNKVLLAFGTWNKQVFCLQQDSCIKKEHSAKTAKYGNMIIKELINDGCFIDEGADEDYFILSKDIYLHSPTAAANLVHGNDRNGQNTWEYLGVPLSSL